MSLTPFQKRIVEAMLRLKRKHRRKGTVEFTTNEITEEIKTFENDESVKSNSVSWMLQQMIRLELLTARRITEHGPPTNHYMLTPKAIEVHKSGDAVPQSEAPTINERRLVVAAGEAWGEAPFTLTDLVQAVKKYEGHAMAQVHVEMALDLMIARGWAAEITTGDEGETQFQLTPDGIAAWGKHKDNPIPPRRV